MQTRKPIVADQFYPGRHNSCVTEINECLRQKRPAESLPETIAAGIVPHAGWTFSGSLAAMVFSAIKQRHGKVDTFIIFGAAHGYYGPSPAVYDKGIWLTPLGEVAVDEELADAILKSDAAVSDTSAHQDEHSIEVQVPFIQHLFADAKILPILTPPNEQAISLGEVVGDIIKQQQKKIVCIGSTAGTLKVIVDQLRQEGIKAGVLRLRTFRPLPVEELRNALKNVKAVAVMDKSMTPGGLGGAVFSEVRNTLYDLKERPIITSYIFGLGGRDTSPRELRRIFDELSRTAKTGHVEKEVHYFGLRD